MGGPAKAQNVSGEAFNVEKATNTGGFHKDTGEGNANNQMGGLSEKELADADMVYNSLAKNMGVHTKEQFHTAWRNMDAEERKRWLSRAKDSGT